jgi:DNA-binding XRE family transcriptional regulator
VQPVASEPFGSTPLGVTNYCNQRMTSERVQQVISDLKRYGQRHKLKQREIAEKLGVSPQQLNDWFTGHREPTADRVLQILDPSRSGNRNRSGPDPGGYYRANLFGIMPGSACPQSYWRAGSGFTSGGRYSFKTRESSKIVTKLPEAGNISVLDCATKRRNWCSASVKDGPS